MKGKGCLIAVLVVVVLLVILAVVLYLNRGKLFEMALEKMVDQIVTNLPEGYDEAVVRATIDEFMVAVKEGRVDKEEFQEIGETVNQMTADKKLETHEVDELMKILQEAAQ